MKDDKHFNFLTILNLLAYNHVIDVHLNANVHEKIMRKSLKFFAAQCTTRNNSVLSCQELIKSTMLNEEHFAHANTFFCILQTFQ